MRRAIGSWAMLTAALSLAGGCMMNTGNNNANGNDNADDDTLNPQIAAGAGFDTALRLGASTGQQEVAICDGWFPNTPNNTLTITEGLGLSISVESDEEPRLWILCGTSNFCGSQIAENTWEFSRFWATGVCEIYVGTPEEGGELGYTLTLTGE